jgi:hypothetical protein
MDEQRPKLRTYFLGGLPEDEASALDERLFVDDQLLHNLEEERELLIEEYVRGVLPADQVQQFREQCSRSPELQQRAKEMQALVDALGRLEEASPLPHRAGWLPRSAGWLLPVALAGGLCAVTTLYIHEFRANRSLGDQIRTSQARVIQPQEVIVGQTSVIFLAANVMRGATSLPRIRIPAAALRIELQVEVRDADLNRGIWTVTIWQADQPVWMSARVPLRRIGQVTFLDLQVDSAVLSPNRYLLQFAPVGRPNSERARQFETVASK